MRPRSRTRSGEHLDPGPKSVANRAPYGIHQPIEWPEINKGVTHHYNEMSQRAGRSENNQIDETSLSKKEELPRFQAKATFHCSFLHDCCKPSTGGL